MVNCEPKEIAVPTSNLHGRLSKAPRLSAVSHGVRYVEWIKLSPGGCDLDEKPFEALY